MDIKNPNKKAEKMVYDRKAIVEKLKNSFKIPLQLLEELNNSKV